MGSAALTALKRVVTRKVSTPLIRRCFVLLPSRCGIRSNPLSPPALKRVVTRKATRHEDFPGGHPSWYYSRPSTLNCRVLMGSAALTALKRVVTRKVSTPLIRRCFVLLPSRCGIRSNPLSKWVRSDPTSAWKENETSHIRGVDTFLVTTHFKAVRAADPIRTLQLKEIKTQAAKYVAKYNGAGKYQVASTWQDQYVVNLNERSCTCRFWEITGIKTQAAKYVAKYNGAGKYQVASTWQDQEDAPDVEDWVHPCYKLSTWRAMYLNKIDPINGRSMWPKSDCQFTLTPPKHHTQVGRPKKKRRRGVDEPNSQTTKLSRKFIAVTCSKCHNKGHNSRTCNG
uniref:SWIM-type domain-containing protein n=1 Tax=Lactuca sativa TaxID=4236 RepID=A0A9R1W5S6_LACSA|nr:hypothetical protein LSAT_V11C300125620 [Lactuca sativa]